MQNAVTTPPDTSWLLVLLSRWRINIGFLSSIPIVLLADPTFQSILTYLPLLLLGAGLRVWARAHLERQTQVTWSGPYAYVRHPLYVGSFLMALAITAMTRLPWAPLIWTVGFALMYGPKIVREERWMRHRFGEDYDRYAAEVGAFFPWPHGNLARLHLPGATTFAWQRVQHHREWKTWLGVAGVLAYLTARAAL